MDGLLAGKRARGGCRRRGREKYAHVNNEKTQAKQEYKINCAKPEYHSSGLCGEREERKKRMNFVMGFNIKAKLDPNVTRTGLSIELSFEKRNIS